jgi:hypothetical protein
MRRRVTPIARAIDATNETRVDAFDVFVLIALGVVGIGLVLFAERKLR